MLVQDGMNGLGKGPWRKHGGGGGYGYGYGYPLAPYAYEAEPPPPRFVIADSNGNTVAVVVGNIMQISPGYAFRRMTMAEMSLAPVPAPATLVPAASVPAVPATVSGIF